MHTEIQRPWVAVIPMPLGSRAPAEENRSLGNGHEILLQGFHWGSHKGVRDSKTQKKKTWYRVIEDNAAAIGAAGFSWVWFPPPSDSLAPQGYIPRRWNALDNEYGNEPELRAAIEKLHPVKAMADVVLNHRVGVHTSGADFADPPFPDNRAAIVRDDESGVGTGNFDSGERHPAGRDLDHTNPDVRATIKNYLGRLKSVGFKGYRYDLVKGFHGRFVGEYNEATAPELSVGEFFDGDRQKVTNWIESTGGRSLAFDFPTRYLLYDALNLDDFHRLRSVVNGRGSPGGLIGFWPACSVTFLDNHDTEYCRETEHRYNNDATRHFPGPLAEMGYAYTLTHPGIPCVFWSHYFDWGPAIQRKINALIQVRKNQGIHSTSHVEIREATRGLYSAFINDRVAVKLGSRSWYPGSGWRVAVDGERFAVWTRND